MSVAAVTVQYLLGKGAESHGTEHRSARTHESAGVHRYEICNARSRTSLTGIYSYRKCIASLPDALHQLCESTDSLYAKCRVYRFLERRPQF